jgi:CDP-glycerol glycerophosphotransferase (TagB/SpsB family)
MREREKARILFCGYAPVHFVCFQPIYKRLSKYPWIDIYFSEGERAKQDPDQRTAKLNQLFRSFRIPDKKILTPEQMKQQNFDMVICSFVSGAFPKSDRVRIHLFHGVSFRNVAIRRDILIYDKLFVVGPYQTRNFVEQKLMREGDSRLVPIGFPKLDPLVDGTLDKKKILGQLGFSGKRPIVLYAPTGQKQNSLETVGEEVILRLKKLNRYDLLIKPHDHPKDLSYNWTTYLKKYEDEHTRIVQKYDIVPYLFASDLLLTDASSVSNEYSLLDRPMVFIDVPELLSAAKNKGQAVDLDTWGRKTGLTARWPDEIVKAVQLSLRNPKQKSSLRKRMAEDMFYNPGNATEKAVDWIINWFNNNSRVANGSN